MKKQVFVIGAAAIVLSFASPVLAQGSGRGPVATTCSSEISRYCADKKHGGGAVRDCLEANWRKLSRKCQATLGNTGFGRRRR